MKTGSRSNCAKCWRNGLTLIEVVVGSAIAGTLLVSLLLSTSAHARQLRATNQKRVAIAFLDRFLASWAQSRYSHEGLMRIAEQSSVSISGTIAGEPLSFDPSDLDADQESGFRIRVTSETSSKSLTTWKIELVRVEVYPQEENSTFGGNPSASAEILRSRE